MWQFFRARPGHGERPHRIQGIRRHSRLFRAVRNCVSGKLAEGEDPFRQDGHHQDGGREERGEPHSGVDEGDGCGFGWCD